MEDKRLREQPLRKVKDFPCIVAADVFRGRRATRGLTRACIRSEPVFFAIKFCDCWHAADFAFAFAYHFYLPFVLSRHSRTRLAGFTAYAVLPYRVIQPQSRPGAFP